MCLLRTVPVRNPGIVEGHGGREDHTLTRLNIPAVFNCGTDGGFVYPRRAHSVAPHKPLVVPDSEPCRMPGSVPIDRTLRFYGNLPASYTVLVVPDSEPCRSVPLTARSVPTPP